MPIALLKQDPYNRNILSFIKYIVYIARPRWARGYIVVRLLIVP